MLRFLVLTFVKLFNATSALASKLVSPGYQVLIPHATYAPWLNDKEFREAYRKVKRESLVNLFQCWELWQLTEDTDNLEGDLIEIGVYRGASSAIMATKLSLLDSKHRLFCCDTFEGVVKPGERDNHYRGGEHADTSQVDVVQLFEELGLTNATTLPGVFPEDTGGQIAERRFRLCHIDVDVYESGRATLEWLWPRLCQGGVVVFNDYGYPRTQGITQLVNEQRQLPGRQVIHNLNGNGILVKTG